MNSIHVKCLAKRFFSMLIRGMIPNSNCVCTHASITVRVTRPTMIYTKKHSQKTREWIAPTQTLELKNTYCASIQQKNAKMTSILTNLDLALFKLLWSNQFLLFSFQIPFSLSGRSFAYTWTNTNTMSRNHVIIAKYLAISYLWLLLSCIFLPSVSMIYGSW